MQNRTFEIQVSEGNLNPISWWAAHDLCVERGRWAHVQVVNNPLKKTLLGLATSSFLDTPTRHIQHDLDYSDSLFFCSAACAYVCWVWSTGHLLTGCLQNPGKLIPTPFFLTPRRFFPDDREVHAEASSNTSLAALIPDSTAPSIHACLSDVCSPAKWIRSWHFHTFSKSSFS